MVNPRKVFFPATAEDVERPASRIFSKTAAYQSVQTVEASVEALAHVVTVH
jgi:hypothetical protein